MGKGDSKFGTDDSGRLILYVPFVWENHMCRETCAFTMGAWRVEVVASDSVSGTWNS
jgi:hypothetical protein